RIAASAKLCASAGSFPEENCALRSLQEGDEWDPCRLAGGREIGKSTNPCSFSPRHQWLPHHRGNSAIEAKCIRWQAAARGKAKPHGFCLPWFGRVARSCGENPRGGIPEHRAC